MTNKNPNTVDIGKTFRRRKRMASVLLAVFPFLWAWFLFVVKDGHSSVFDEHDAELVISIILIVLSVIVFGVKWHCPVCNKYFGMNPNIKQCSKCQTVYEVDKQK